MADPLNFHHLMLFRAVAREGGVTAAARRLGLTQPTVSAQVAALEERLGEPLFDRVGRRLELTERGRLVLGYADDVAALGDELVRVVGAGAPGRPRRVAVGVVDALPKVAVARLLAPALRLPGGVRLTCREAALEDLLGDLAAHRLDLVLSDAPVPPGASFRLWGRLLGESRVAFFAAPQLAARLREGFPASLEGAPLLAPWPASSLGRALAEWLDRRGLRPSVAAELDDSALLKALAAEGLGAFAGPAAFAADLRSRWEVEEIGRVDLVERFWSIRAERRVRHPAILAVEEGAAAVFGAESGAHLHSG